MANATQDASALPAAPDPFDTLTAYVAANHTPLVDVANEQMRQLTSTFNALIDAIACRSDEAYSHLGNMRRQISEHAKTQRAVGKIVNAAVSELTRTKIVDIGWGIGLRLAMLSKQARTHAGDEVHEGLRYVD